MRNFALAPTVCRRSVPGVTTGKEVAIDDEVVIIGQKHVPRRSLRSHVHKTTGVTGARDDRLNNDDGHVDCDMASEEQAEGSKDMKEEGNDEEAEERQMEQEEDNEEGNDGDAEEEAMEEEDGIDGSNEEEAEEGGMENEDDKDSSAEQVNAVVENYGLQPSERPRKRTARRQCIRLFGHVWSRSYYEDDYVVPTAMWPRNGLDHESSCMLQNGIISQGDVSHDAAICTDPLDDDDPTLWPAADPRYFSCAVDGKVVLTRTLKPSICTKSVYKKYLQVVTGLSATYAAESKIHGTGLFVVKAVDKGDYVIEYTGIRRSGESARTLHDASDRRGYQPNTLVTVDSGDIIPENLSVLDTRGCGNIAKHINDSCEPNCELVTVSFGTREVVMVRAIARLRVHVEATAY